MNIRSGVFIKYNLTFSDGAGSGGGFGAALASLVGVNGSLPLKISNDVLDGDFCIDADIVVSMHRWAAGADCLIKLYDLPEPKVRLLEAAVQKPKAAPTVAVSLGYFDTSADPVFTGVFYDVSREVSGDRLVTNVKARDTALYACATTSDCVSLSKPASYADALSAILSTPKLPSGCVAQAPQMSSNAPSDQLTNFSVSGSLLNAIDGLAVRANGEFLICDGKVFFGAPIQNDSAPGATLDYATNLAKFDPITKKMLNPDGSDDELNATGFVFTMTGDSGLRPGQKIAVNNIKGFDSPEFRIRHIRHELARPPATSAPAHGGFGQWRAGPPHRRRSRFQRRLLGARLDRSCGKTSRRQSIDRNGRGQNRRGQSGGDALLRPDAARRGDAALDSHRCRPQGCAGPDPVAMLSPFAWANCGLATPVIPA